VSTPLVVAAPRVVLYRDDRGTVTVVEAPAVGAVPFEVLAWCEIDANGDVVAGAVRYRPVRMDMAGRAVVCARVA
jgi:hypothetical protein